jgi:hypothetical protein
MLAFHVKAKIHKQTAYLNLPAKETSRFTLFAKQKRADFIFLEF